MKDSRPSLLEVSKTLGKTFEIAEAMGSLAAPKHKAITALLQVDPSDPEYKSHTGDIVSLCEDLLKEYKDNKKDLDDEWSKTDKNCKSTKASLNKQLSANDGAMKQLDKDISRLAKEIARHREDLVTADNTLKDDELYLKDLTARCEDRANDYDQRSAMRGDEVTALTTALKVLSGSVKGADEAANERAMLIQKYSHPVAKTAPIAAK